MGLALGVVAVYVFVFARMGSPVERSHLLEYSVVALLIHEALEERASNGRRVPLPGAIAVLLTFLLGVLDEGIQLAIPSRVFDPVDIGFNLLAAVLAVGGRVILSWAQRLRRQSSR